MKVRNKEVIGDFIYEQIKELILTKQIRCGEKIVEQKLEERFGVSRTPVREAVRQLAMDGIVNIYPNRYAEVITFTDKSIREFGCVRIAIDCLAAQLAIQNASNSEFKALGSLAEKCTEAQADGSLYDRIKYDSDFHVELARLSKNPLLYDFESKLCFKQRLIQTYMEDSNTPAACDVHQHEQIVQALIGRNVTKVLNLISQHLYPYYRFEATDFYLPVLSSLNAEIGPE